MDYLQKNNKISKSQANAAHILTIVLIVVFVLVALLSILLMSYSFNVNQMGYSSSQIPMKSFLYILGGIVGLSVVFVLFNSRYEMYFQKRQQIGINRSLPKSGQFWQPGKNQDNFTVKSDEFHMTNANTYGMSLELNVIDSRSDDPRGPFRHIVHRGSKDIVDFKRNSPGSLPKGRGSLNDGLPSEMNPGVFVDQFTNDLIIFIDTDPVKSSDYGFRESVRVTDIPLKKPFTLHLTLHDQILEIYINCRLAGSKVLHGIPRPVANNWYGLAGFSSALANIQNLKLWDMDLYATEIRNMCSDIKMDTKATELIKSKCSKC